MTDTTEIARRDQRRIENAAAIQGLSGTMATFAFAFFVMIGADGGDSQAWQMAGLCLPGVGLLILSFFFYRRRRWAARVSAVLHVLTSLAMALGAEAVAGEGSVFFLLAAVAASLCGATTLAFAWAGRSSLH